MRGRRIFDLTVRGVFVDGTAFEICRAATRLNNLPFQLGGNIDDGRDDKRQAARAVVFANIPDGVVKTENVVGIYSCIVSSEPVAERGNARIESYTYITAIGNLSAYAYRALRILLNVVGNNADGIPRNLNNIGIRRAAYYQRGTVIADVDTSALSARGVTLYRTAVKIKLRPAPAAD